MDWIVIICVLALSAFFSGMEIAYIASSKLRVELDRKEYPLFAKISTIFLSHPAQYLSTILIGNNIALVIYSMVFSSLIAAYVSSNIVLETLISSVIVILLGEFLPKAIVKRNPHVYFRIFAVPILFFYFIFYPIAKFCEFLSKVLGWIFTGKYSAGNNFSSKFEITDLQDLVEDGVKQGEGENDVQASDLEMFQKALDFSELKVRDCMIPRVEVEAVDVAEGISKLKERFIQTQYSRIPIYEGTIDKIIGYASSKDLFRQDITQIKDMLLDVVYTPESGSVQKLLENFIRTRKSIAVVIDEFGATAGIVTIEDIIEQIVGNIEDEHDEDYKVERQIGSSRWLFSGRHEIEYLNEKYGFEIPINDEYDTLAGWILFNSEEFPNVGANYRMSGLNVEIKRASDNRITLVEISR